MSVVGGCYWVQGFFGVGVVGFYVFWSVGAVFLRFFGLRGSIFGCFSVVRVMVLLVLVVFLMLQLQLQTRIFS